MELWDTTIPDPHGVDARQRAYAQWRAAVLRVRDMSESRLRKLYKHNYSPEDIAADRHWAEFPPQRLNRRFKPGMAIGEKRGRLLTPRDRQRFYAQALWRQAEWLLNYRRLEGDMLATVRADVETFKKLVERFKQKED